MKVFQVINIYYIVSLGFTKAFIPGNLLNENSYFDNE